MFGPTRSLTSALLIGGLALLAAGEAPAQDLNQGQVQPEQRQVQPEQRQVQPEQVISISAPRSTLDTNRGRPVSLDVQAAEIGTVLRSLASFSGANIVASPRVAGKVTVKLEDVPWQQALSVILRSHNFDYVEEDGIYRVDTIEELRQEKLAAYKAERAVSELADLQLGKTTLAFAKADEIANSLGQMLTNRGSIDVDERTNSLVINDIADRVNLIIEMARQLDTQTPRVEYNARLIDMDARASREVGISWGIANFKPGGANVAGAIAVNNPVGDPSGALKIGTVQSFGDMMIKVEALEKSNRAKIISNPILTTTDNREATILVGQKIPLIVSDEAGNAITQLTTIGIQLQVTPHINGPDQITLDIHNEISDLSSEATVQGGVIINTNESDTQVVVQNGETAIIGGLIRDVETYSKRGLPLLKDIPLLGALFRSSSKSTNSRELVIFVTPRIVTPEYMRRDLLSQDSELVTRENKGFERTAGDQFDLR